MVAVGGSEKGGLSPRQTPKAPLPCSGAFSFPEFGGFHALRYLWGRGRRLSSLGDQDRLVCPDCGEYRITARQMMAQGGQRFDVDVTRILADRSLVRGADAADRLDPCFNPGITRPLRPAKALAPLVGPVIGDGKYTACRCKFLMAKGIASS